MLDDVTQTLTKRCSVMGDGSEISDVYNGIGYKQHSRFLSQPTNLSLMMNTDGVAVFKSSTVSLWPIWIVINELPLAKRYTLNLLI